MTENTPVNIKKSQLKALREHINERFNIFGPDGKIDIEKCQMNVGYAIGSYYTTYNGLLMREKHKLAEVVSALNLAKAKAYDDIKMEKIKYDLDSRGMGLMVEGHELVREKKVDFDKQTAYVEFLENTVKQIGYYTNGIKTIFEGEKLRVRQEQ